MYDLLEVDNDIISTKDETSDKTIKAQFEDSDDLFSRYTYSRGTSKRYNIRPWKGSQANLKILWKIIIQHRCKKDN